MGETHEISHNQIKADSEMLHNAKRPCAIVVQMKYKGHRHNFAIPLRSNINASTPKDLYFALPPRSTTRPKNHHGLHFEKMFPVSKSYLMRFRTEGNKHSQLIKRIIDENEDVIKQSCWTYLRNYENGKRTKYSTDLDLLIQIMVSDESN